MERIRLVAFYVFAGDRGMRLEVAVQTPTGRASSEHYGDLTAAELAQVVEATLEAVRPGDLIGAAGEVMPQLFR